MLLIDKDWYLMGVSNLNSSELYENPDFQSAMVRLGIWGFAVIYVSFGALSERYDVDINRSFILFAIFLLCFISILISVVIHPVWGERRYVTLAVDVSATTVCIYLTGEGSSPFFILYIWIFVSYGARYGKQHLTTASIMSIIAYSGVLTLMGQWEKYFFEASFVLLALAVLPVYQFSLMRQLQNARSEAERSNLMVGKFLSNMTNDMRGPLVDIQQTTKELSQQKLQPWQLDKVDEINSSASILDSVIGDVLDFYKLESKQLHLQSAPFDMHALILEVCLSVAKLALVKDKELVVSIESGVPKIIVGDEQRLKQVLTNVMRSSINCCLGGEIQVCVQIDQSNFEMLLFEIKGVIATPLVSDIVVGSNNDFLNEGKYPGADSGMNPDLGDSFAGMIISLVGGQFWSGSGDDGIIYGFSFPAITDDFYTDELCKKSGLQGKRVFLLEPNKVSREEIIKCCVDQDMSVSAVNKVSELSKNIFDGDEVEDKERQGVDLVIIADSTEGRDMSRITDLCLEVFGSDIPLLVLSYRHACLDLSEYSSVALVIKPFIREQLTEAMELALAES